MKIKSLVAMCMLVLLFGVTTFMVNADACCKSLASAEADKLTDEIVKLTKELSADSDPDALVSDPDALADAIRKKVEKNYPDATVSLEGVKVIQVDPSGSDADAVVSDTYAFVDAIMRKIKKNYPDATVRLENVILKKDGVKVFEINPDKSKKIDGISELKEQFNQLQDRIAQLIQEFETADSQSSENPK